MGRILSIDEGTTGVRGVVVDEHGTFLGSAYREFAQHFPRPGWVEHDAEEIWEATVTACRDALADATTRPDQIVAVGITNQRETTVVWDRSSGRPIHNAIVWQDRRTAATCDQLTEAGHADTIRATTGLVVDAYFSGTKIAWTLDAVEGARGRAQAGELAFGTMDSWLVWNLTGGAVHATEPSNACRTMLVDLATTDWSPAMLDLLDVPEAVLPEIRDSAGDFGRTDPDRFLGIDAPISGIAGDQQSALFGQGCWTPGMSKNTYGTGSFLLMNTGDEPATSDQGLLTSIGWRIDGRTTYVLEGAIFVTGAAVQWLRDGLGIIDRADDTEALAREVPAGNEGVYLVPAFTGLGAPHWDPYARGTIVGLTRGTGRAHFARAAIEAMAYQSVDVVDLMVAESGHPIRELRVDGGACRNDVLCQFQADVLGAPVVRPTTQETTVLGAAFLAGLGAGVWSSTDDLEGVWNLDRRFEPTMEAPRRKHLLAGWREAVTRSCGWANVVEG